MIIFRCQTGFFSQPFLHTWLRENTKWSYWKSRKHCRAVIAPGISVPPVLWSWGQQKQQAVKGQSCPCAHLISKKKVTFCGVLRITCDAPNQLQHRSYPCSKGRVVKQKMGISSHSYSSSTNAAFLQLSVELSSQRATHFPFSNPCQLHSLEVSVTINHVWTKAKPYTCIWGFPLQLSIIYGDLTLPFKTFSQNTFCHSLKLRQDQTLLSSHSRLRL